jgi:hypothetical protein
MLYAIGTLVVAVSGCASMQIQTDYDPAISFSDYRTYRWMPTSPTSDPRVNNAITEGRIHGAVDSVLSARGYRKLGSGNVDFLVGYHAAIEGALDAIEMARYYGYRPATTSGAWDEDVLVRSHSEGTLIIDVVDAGMNELVWRGTAKAEVSLGTPTEQRRKQIYEATSKILERFPPGP